MKSENTVKKQSAGYILQKFSAIVILLAIIVIMSIGSENFFSGKNFLNILNQSAVLGIMAIGMTFVIITGGIDLSVGSLMALCLLYTSGEDRPFMFCIIFRRGTVRHFTVFLFL